MKNFCEHDYNEKAEHKHSNKNWFIRTYICGRCGKKQYSVLDINDGAFVGRVSNGSDCTFDTLKEAQNYA